MSLSADRLVFVLFFNYYPFCVDIAHFFLAFISEITRNPPAVGRKSLFFALNP